jgi:hypothetical protein
MSLPFLSFPAVLAVAGCMALHVVPRAEAGYSVAYAVDTVIPDDSSTGLLDSRMVSLEPVPIAKVRIAVSLSPVEGDVGFLGDLYLHVEHGGVRSVLLNRPGRRVGVPTGYDDDVAMTVTFDDGSPDIHGYRVSPSTPLTGPLTGTFGPDARATDPSTVMDADARTLFLEGFEGMDPSGEWNLFVADLSGGGVHRLEGWALDIAVIPESGIWGVLGGWLLWVGGREVLRRRAGAGLPVRDRVTGG